jgi:hypothetical protein
MKLSISKFPLCGLLMIVALVSSGAGVPNFQGTEAQPPAESVLGVWRGESLCATAAGSCKNEQVVYYIEAIPHKSDVVFIRADKIVDGKAITMGSGPWQYDQARQTLRWEVGQRLWLLIVKSKRMEGALTESGDVVFRRMTLAKDD